MTIIVPYRNRPDHLAEFIPHIRTQCPGAKLLIVEQAEGKPFNRGRLLNIGYLETNPDYFIAHDVDHLPVRFNYSSRKGVTQLASSTIQRHGFLGAVTMYDAKTFDRLGGYNNDYFHRAEDNEMYFNIQRMRWFMNPIQNRFGTFKTLPHPRSGPEFIPELWQKAQQPRIVQNQLAVCKYHVISDVQHPTHRHIIVEI